MTKKNQQLSETEVLARMASGFQKRSEKTEEKIETTTDPATTSKKTIEYPEKEKNADDEGAEQQLFISKEIHGAGNGRRSSYEEKFLKRVISGSFRSNVGISRDTLDIAERVIARLFDNKIAVSAYVDNILVEHFNKYKRDFDMWLAERPVTIF
jgi:hypothetical protein